jgi:hypothetical protein
MLALAALLVGAYAGTALAQSHRLDGKNPENTTINRNEQRQLREMRLNDERSRAQNGVLPRDADIFEHTHEAIKKKMNSN